MYGKRDGDALTWKLTLQGLRFYDSEHQMYAIGL